MLYMVQIKNAMHRVSIPITTTVKRLEDNAKPTLSMQVKRKFPVLINNKGF